MNEKPTTPPDVDHLKWAINRRADIQHTLLALYDYVNRTPPDRDWVKNHLLDHLIAASFSLWRAAFLSESDREMADIHKSQKAFLASVVSTNAITFQDDYKNRAWTVSYYLEAAKYRLGTAHHIADHHMKHKSLDKVLPLIRLRGTDDMALTRYEWECTHSALRIIFKVFHPDLSLPMLRPNLPNQ